MHSPYLLSAQSTINIKTVYLVDNNLPTLSIKDIQEIINEGYNEFNIKFGTNDFKFQFLGIKPLNTFFKKNLKRNDPYYQDLTKKQYTLFSDTMNYKPFQNEILEFLKQWKLWDLKNFFPKEIQEKISTYEEIIPYLYQEYLNKIKILENIKQKNNKYLIHRKNNLYNSYINWLAVMREQDAYDLVISNTIIVYDAFTQPYPHAVLRFAKVGGSSFESPKRPTFDGTTAMINLFEMLTDIPYFKQDPSLKKLSRSLWNKIIGRYILAHEMGHMIFFIPDVYDHPQGCLMDSSMENLDYYAGYKVLVQYPIQCPKCQPYVTARIHHFKGDQLFNKKDYENAAYEYKLTKKMTPEKLDIDYNSYMSLLNYKMAKCYIELKDKSSAQSYLNEAIKLDPKNSKAIELLKSFK